MKCIFISVEILSRFGRFASAALSRLSIALWRVMCCLRWQHVATTDSMYTVVYATLIRSVTSNGGKVIDTQAGRQADRQADLQSTQQGERSSMVSHTVSSVSPQPAYKAGRETDILT